MQLLLTIFSDLLSCETGSQNENYKILNAQKYNANNHPSIKEHFYCSLFQFYKINKQS